MKFGNTTFITDDIQIIEGGAEGEVPKGHIKGCGGFGQPVLGFQPWIGDFCLLVVFEHLLEQSQMVVEANAVAL